MPGEHRPAARQHRQQRAFTLLEMLTVMVIMVMLMTLGSAAWFQMRRGAELRGAVSTLRTALILGRQQAVTRRRDVMVIFRQEGETNVFYLFEKSGNVTAGGGVGSTSFSDTSGALQSMPVGAQVSNYVCNLSKKAIGMVRTVDPVSGTVLLYNEGTWDTGDEYGWSAHPPYYLPPGIQFASLPADKAIRFTPEGGAGGAGQAVVRILEKQGSPAQGRIVTVYLLTGIVTVTDYQQ